MFMLPRRHARPADAVLDDREQRAVTQALDRRLGQVGHLWIHVGADVSLPVSISAMTDRAVVLEVIQRSAPGLRIAAQGIRRLLELGRNRETHETCRDAPFE